MFNSDQSYEKIKSDYRSLLEIVHIDRHDNANALHTLQMREIVNNFKKVEQVENDAITIFNEVVYKPDVFSNFLPPQELYGFDVLNIDHSNNIPTSIFNDSNIVHNFVDV